MNYEKKVRVIGDDLGNVIHPTKDFNIGYIRVEQFVEIINNGWIKIQNRSALIKGDIKSLQLLNYKKNQTIDGKIIVKESVFPFSQEYPEKNYKIAGKTGVICKFYDVPIYRNTIYTLDENEKDELLQHTNKDEIKASMVIEKISMEELE